MPQLAFSASFEYLCVHSFSAGIDFRRQIHKRQILTVKVDPRAVRANISNIAYMWDLIESLNKLLFYIFTISAYCSSIATHGSTFQYFGQFLALHYQTRTWHGNVSNPLPRESLSTTNLWLFYHFKSSPTVSSHFS